MTAARLLAQLKRRDIRLWSENGQLRYDAPRGAMTGELRAEIKARRAELLDLFRHSARVRNMGEIARVSRDGELSLSFSQQRLWFLQHLEPESLAYNVPVTVGLQGALDVDALRQGLLEMVRRHETLRTTFPTVDGRARVCITPASDVAMTLETEDLGDLPEPERWDEAVRRSRVSAARPFDLEHGPLFRSTLFRLRDDEHVLHIGFHHIIADGWSFGVFFRELSALYEAFHAGMPSPLPELAVQYVDYAHWQREQMQGAAFERDLAYWTEQLADHVTLHVPTDRPRRPNTSRGAMMRITVPNDVAERIKTFSQEHDATPFMTVLAVFNILLSRWAGQTDVVIGTPIAGRRRKEVEGLVGFFVNNLVLRTDLTGNPRFVDLLKRVRSVVLDAYARPDVPFEKLIEELQPEREVGRNPLFQVLINHFNLGAVYEHRLGDLKFRSPDTTLDSSKFDLTLHCFEDRGRFCSKLEYNTDLFDAETMERLGERYVNLLRAVVDRPELPIDRLSVITGAERERVLVEWNRTEEQHPDRCVHELFAEHAQRNPDAEALVFEGDRLTYAELDERATRLARRLRSLGVRPETRVALFFERSAEVMIALLGVLKAGGAYVPLDPTYPPERLAFMLSDSDVRVVLTRRAQRDDLPSHPAPVICVDDPAELAGGGDAPLRPRPARLQDLAYVIYTSGSTGQPKGVEIEHAQLSNYVHAILPRLDLPVGSRYATASTLAADLGNTVIYAALCGGGCLHVMSERRIGDGDAFGEYMRQEAIDCIKIVPSHLEALLSAARQPEHVPPARLLVLGGEACPAELVAQVRTLRPTCEVMNHYGPTETTVGVLTHRLAPDDGDQFPFGPPIGRPIANTTAYVLDDTGEPAPIGAVGELYIGGRSVARGYQNQPELTSERFVRDRFGGNGRLYRTGDLVRYLPDGHLHFIGRKDHQFKVRGFRIEPGEIEATLERHPAVTAAAVVVHEDDARRKRLVAYVATTGGAAPPFSELRAVVTERLPNYMVPSAYVVLDELPLTTNGKLDRSALPDPDFEHAEPEARYAAPRTATEATLAEIWSAVLRVERVGIHDDFFDLGGESILSIQIISRATQAGLRLTPRDLFERPTIAELATVAGTSAAPVAEQGVITGPVPLTPSQHRFFEQELADAHHYNHARLLETRVPLRPALVEQAVEHLIVHHDVLRSRYTRHDSGWTQEIVESAQPIPFTCFDLTDVPEVEHSRVIERTAAELHESFDLTHGPLVRVALFQPGRNGQDRLLLVLHHLVVDSVSWRILLEDLETIYKQLDADRAVELPPKTTSYRAWSERLTAYANSPRVLTEAAHWRRVVGATVASLPVDHRGREADNLRSSAGMVSASLTEAETEALLREVPRAFHTQINDVLLTALAQTLVGWTGGSVLRLDLEGHGRETLFDDIDVSRTVGWFTSDHPVLLDLSGIEGPGAALRAIKEQLRAIPRRGSGWAVLRYLTSGESPLGGIGCRPSEIGFHYVSHIYRPVEDASLWNIGRESAGAIRSPRNRRRYLLDIVGAVQSNRLQLDWVYSRNVHDEATIEGVATRFLAALRTLIEYCTNVESEHYTPSDFPLARLTDEELERLERRFPSGIESVFTLSPLQKGMVFHTLTDPTSAAYTTQFVFTLRGELDPGALRCAWQQVLDHHAVLRMAVVVDGLAEMHQIVCRDVALRWELDDWREVEESERARRLDALAREERHRGFDLADPPLMRLHLVRVAEDRWRFIWTHHHVLIDGWSLPLLIKDVFRAYASARTGVTQHLEPARPFDDYIRWLYRQDPAEAEAFWRTHLQGRYEPTPLPLRPGARRAVRDATLSSRRTALLDEETTSALHTLARRHQLTLNTIIQGSWALLLSRYSGASEVVFGVVVSGRPAELRDVDTMLGMFINTLPARVETSDAELLPWLHDLQSQQLEFKRFEYYPLYEIQQLSAGGRNARLFDSIFVFENFPRVAADPNDRHGLRLEDPQDASHVTFPLAAVIRPGGSRLCLELRYDTSCFDEDTIARMLEHFCMLLEAMAANPSARLAQLPKLTAPEEHRVVFEWNQTERPFPAGVCIHELVEQRVREAPESVAVVLGEQQLTYRELNARANQLAHTLRAMGVGPDVLVGLCTERSLEMIVGWLGILKAGGAYVPLDPTYPPERLAFMIEDCGAPVLLTQAHLLDGLPQHDASVLRLDADREAIAAAPETDPDCVTRPDNLAYMIYTSGSTGRPKGAMLSHHGLMNLSQEQQLAFGVTSESRVLQFSSLSFDASTFEIVMALPKGATLVLGSRDALRPGPDLLEFLRSHEISIVTLPPTALAALEPTELPALRTITVAGEACPPELPARWAPGRQFFNLYGPTETTIWATMASFSGDEPAVHVGRPIANTRVYLLDADRRPVPVGVPGEMYIGGVGLARGYHDRPALTAERFVPSPFHPGERLYRTGDVARFGAEGDLEFLGRADHQVKLRGFRIELGEIESSLLDIPDVREAVVLCREDVAGEKTLVAYVVGASDGSTTRADLRALLAETLPDYMIPATFVFLDALPQGPSGKIDRKALPAPAGDRDVDVEFVAPRTELESQLAEIWQEVLGVDRVGLDDNFFDLGGHSLLALQVTTRIKERTGCKIGPAELIMQTLGQLAAVCARELQRTATDGEKKGWSRRLLSGIGHLVSPEGGRSS